MAEALEFLKSRPAQMLSLALLVHAGLFYSLTPDEKVPPRRPLKEFPMVVGKWAMVEETPVSDEVQSVLRADDTLSRYYVPPGARAGAHLFAAYFHSQRSGAAPHSPKNCLPGSGWAPLSSGTVKVQFPGRNGPDEINRYVVAMGESRSAVYYWYQTHRRIIASEYWAKIYLVLDAIRDNRSDTSLIRVVVPIVPGEEERADRTAVEFIQSIFQPLGGYLPS
jgi:EpsI family protein